MESGRLLPGDPRLPIRSMLTLLNRLLSLSVCGLCVYAVHARSENPGDVFKACVGLIFPLACIWFGDLLGQYTGPIRGHFPTVPTPGWLVAAGGWFILIGAPLAAFWIRKGI